MNRIRKNSLTLLLLLTLFLAAGITLPLQADVFSFWPFRGGLGGAGGAYSGIAPESIFNPESLRKEPVLVNGKRVLLECSLGENFSLQEALRLLRRQYPKGKAAMNQDALLFEGPIVNGYRKKLLFITFPGMDKGILFTMNIPAKGFSTPVWPPELPMIPGMRPQSVISFPERRSIYGQAASSLSPQELLSHLSMEMKAQGWIAPAREHTLRDGSGEVFFRQDSSQLLIFGILPMQKQNGAQESIVTIYSRKLR